MAEIDLAEARELTTASEMKVVRGATNDGLEGASPAELTKRIAQARKLRDKWQDLATSQRRESQRARGSRSTDDATRSRRKAEIFGTALARLESRLSEIGSTGEATAPPPPKKTTSGQRTRAHRDERAGVRKALTWTTEDYNRAEASKKPVGSASGAVQGKKKAASKKQAKASIAKKAAKKKASKKGLFKKASKKGLFKKASKKGLLKKASVPASKKSTANRPPKFAPSGGVSKRQPGAKASAKQTRIDVSGLTSRTRGHVSARTKRDQGRRDQKG